MKRTVFAAEGTSMEAEMMGMVERLWSGLREAGMPEVMLYLPDGTASRCHWDETALVGSTRVALLADQDRGIVRLVAVSACSGIGIASPKGIDPSGFRSIVRDRLTADATRDG